MRAGDLVAATWAQSRVSLRRGGPLLWWIAALGGTGVGEALDVLGHLDGRHDAVGLALSMSGIANLGLGAWTGAAASPAAALLETPWPWGAVRGGLDLPRTARVASAAVFGGSTSCLCLLFTLVSGNSIGVNDLALGLLTGALVAGPAAALGAVLAPWGGSATAWLTALGLLTGAFLGASGPLMGVLPPVFPRGGVGILGVLSGALTMLGLLLVAPSRAR